MHFASSEFASTKCAVCRYTESLRCEMESLVKRCIISVSLRTCARKFVCSGRMIEFLTTVCRLKSLGQTFGLCFRFVLRGNCQEYGMTSSGGSLPVCCNESISALVFICSFLSVSVFLSHVFVFWRMVFSCEGINELLEAVPLRIDGNNPATFPLPTLLVDNDKDLRGVVVWGGSVVRFFSFDSTH